jgi:TadE-like protein
MPAMFRWCHRPRGQALAEFAIVFPVLMLIMGGVIQFGIIFWGQNTLTQIARDTGRWAASQKGCIEGTTPPAVDVLGTARSIAASSSLIGSSSGWTYGLGANVYATWPIVTGTNCPPVDNRDVVYVTITLKHQVPLFFPFVPGNGNLTTSAQFRMEPTTP